MKNIIVTTNEFIAVAATKVMSTMWMVYVLLAVSVAPFFIPEYKDFIQYVSSSVIQLVALPLIMVGQSIISRASENRALQDHDTLMAQHAELRKQITLLRQLRNGEKDQSAAIGELSAKIDQHRTCSICEKRAAD